MFVHQPVYGSRSQNSGGGAVKAGAESQIIKLSDSDFSSYTPVLIRIL